MQDLWWVFIQTEKAIMYVILGATGQVGSSALATLLQLAPDVKVRAIARHRSRDLADHVEWHEVDVTTDVDGLTAAMQGATAVFVMNPVSANAADVYRDAAQISGTIAAAIKQAGGPRIVALSSQGAHLSAGTGVITTLHDFEAKLRTTGAPLTCVRSTFFMESWLPFAAAAMDSGQWWAMRDLPDEQDNTVSARDVGTVIARCLLDADSPAIVNVTGARTYSEADAAGGLASLSGRAIEVVPVPASERAGAFEGAGLSPSYARALADMHDALDAGRVPFEPAPDTRYGTTPLEDVLRSVI